MDRDNVNQEEAPREVSNSILDNLYSRRNHHEKEFHRLNRQIEMINQNPIIAEFLKISRP